MSDDDWNDQTGWNDDNENRSVDMNDGWGSGMYHMLLIAVIYCTVITQ